MLQQQLVDSQCRRRWCSSGPTTAPPPAVQGDVSLQAHTQQHWKHPACLEQKRHDGGAVRMVPDGLRCRASAIEPPPQMLRRALAPCLSSNEATVERDVHMRRMLHNSRRSFTA